MQLPVDSYVPHDRLATSKDKARAFLGRHGRNGRDFLVSQLVAQGAPELIKELDKKPHGDAVVARVNHGRWIGDCPVCGGAEVVDPDDPVFMCLSCLNDANQRKVRPVDFPDENFRLRMGEVLVHRGERRARGWDPGETIEDLKRQNRGRGDRE